MSHKFKKHQHDEDQELIKKHNIMQSDIDKIRGKFNKYEKKDTISLSDVKTAINDLFGVVDEFIKNEIENELKKINKQHKHDRISYQGFAELYCTIKNTIDNADYEAQYAEYLDAFVALGGNPDRTGSVDKNQIINILTLEFELTIDIQDFIKKLDADNDNDLDFNEFVLVFESGFDDSKSRQSMASALTKNSQKLLAKNSSLYQLKPGFYEQRDKEFDKLLLRDGKDKSINSGFSVKDKDFEKWFAKNGF